jgi:hypothetical protein
MTVKNPDGSNRELPEVTHALAKQVMTEAKNCFDEAERHRAKDWSMYSRCFMRAHAIEDCAVKLQNVMTAPHAF